jgi:hypothetical protein
MITFLIAPEEVEPRRCGGRSSRRIPAGRVSKDRAMGKPQMQRVVTMQLAQRPIRCLRRLSYINAARAIDSLVSAGLSKVS